MNLFDERQKAHAALGALTVEIERVRKRIEAIDLVLAMMQSAPQPEPQQPEPEDEPT